MRAIGGLEDDRRPPEPKEPPEITLEVVKNWWVELDFEHGDHVAGTFVNMALYGKEQCQPTADMAVVAEQFRKCCIAEREKEILEWLQAKSRIET